MTQSGGADRRATGARAGIFTFLFTDLVDSTATASRLDEAAADGWRRSHFALLRTAIAAHAGEEVKTLGDGMMAVFTSPTDAVAAAAAIQSAVAAHNGARGAIPLSVRIGLHTGEPVCEDGDYFGTPVVVAARLCAAAGGGQVLAGDLVATLVGDRGGFRFRSMGELELKGLSRPQAAVELLQDAPTSPQAGRSGRPGPRRARRALVRGPDLVGRDEELERLEDEFARAASGEFRCVLLCGEAGLGKTRLARELLARRDAEATVLSSRAHELAAGVSFGVWAEALEPLLDELGDDEVADLCGGFLDDLAGLFHRVAALRGPWSGGTGQEAPRPRLLAGITRMVAELAERGPVLVLLDDAHWADASSWEVLRQLARRLADAPVLVVLTARPVELAEQDVAAAVLFELDQDGLSTRYDLRPLAPPGLRALAEQAIGRPAGEALVDWVFERSRGNPLFAIGLLRALLEEGADLTAPQLQRLPEGLAERVTARLRGIPAGQMPVLELLAVAGRPVSLGELMSLSSSSLEAIGPLLAELVATRGVVEIERGRSLSYELSHPLVREVVYAQIGGARRRSLHQQLGRVLREAGRVAEAAVHYGHSAEPGDPDALAVLLEALGEAEQRQAVTEALTLLGALVDLLPAEDPRWLEVLDVLHGQAEWIGEHRADTHAEVTVAALRAVDRHLGEDAAPARRALVKFRLAHFLGWGTGDVQEAELVCTQARDLFLAADDDHHARLAERELAWIHGLCGDLAGSLKRAEALVASAEAAGDDEAMLLAYAAAIPQYLVLLRIGEAEAANARVREIAGRTARAYRLTVAANMDGFRLALCGRMTEARTIFAEGQRLDPQFRETGLLEGLAMMSTWTGDFATGLAAAQEMAVWAPGIRRRRIIGMLAGAAAAAELGEVDEAKRHLNRADAVLAGRDWQFYLPMARYIEGLLAWSARDTDTAARLLSASAERLMELECYAFGMSVVADVSQLLCSLGDQVGTARMVELVAPVGLIELDTASGAVALTEAWGHLAEGAPTAAMEAARRAVDHYDRTEWLMGQARARHALGLASIAAGDAQGVAALEEAARGYAHCGSEWRRAMVLETLRRQGSSGRRALAAALGPTSLTRREREVAQLAAQGRSAKEIAQVLFVGERTVETHLGNIYAKLGVDSKLDLVRRAAELDLS